MHVQSSAEESRDGVDEGETVHRLEFESQFSVVVEESSIEESGKGVEEVDIAHRPDWLIMTEDSSAEESREGLAVGELVREGIEGQGQEIHAQSSAGESREGVEQAETTQGPEIERQFAKSSVTMEEAEIGVQSPAEESREGVEEIEIVHGLEIETQFAGMVEETETVHAPETEDQFTESSVVTEQSSSEESREGMEEADISHRPEIEAQFTELSVIVEEAKIGHGRGSKAQSLGLTVVAEVSQSSVIGDTSYESCKLWLSRGNEAYGKDHFSKAESFYTRAVNFAFEIHPQGRCIQALTLCHGNRAATRMYLGRMLDAIGDCEIALSIDPKFLRARVRMASCYLALGDIEAAMNNYNTCFQSHKDASSERNRKILFEASDGLKKAQQVVDCMNQSMELLQKRTKADAMKVLRIISEAMSISTHSESLLEIKAECLCLVGKYEEIIQICKHTLNAEKNSIIIGDSGYGNQIVSEDKLWRWRVLSMAYFYLGRLEQALELLQKHENVKPLADKFGSMFPQTSTLLSVVIRRLLDLKAAGNAAFHARKFSDAAGHYTAALALSVESRPFAAICLCSRAAAYQELGRVTDAISDCCFAITLDSRNLEAISKRATLYELIRDYEQATNDLKLLISILGNQIKDQSPMFDFSKGLANRQSDLEQARRWLCTLEEKARKGTRTDMYMILGVTRGSSMTDVKNAYRRAALKHHPDKSGVLLITSENVNEGLWKEIAEQVHLDAERIFKLIGEAYDILSDASKRQKYEEEETRLMMKTSNAYAHRSNKGYEQSRNARYAHQSDPRAGNEGYEESRNAGYQQNRNTSGFKQGYEHSRNPGYAHRSGPRAGYEQSRNPGYAHRSGPRTGNTRYEESSYASNFHRRYPQFNYEDMDAQYDQQGQRWDYRWRDDRR